MSAGSEQNPAGGFAEAPLVRVGVAAWTVIGVAVTAMLAIAFISISASVSIPLILALVIGTVSYPLVERLIRRGVPKNVAAGFILAALVAIVVVTIWMTFDGVISQWTAIAARLDQGIAAVANWLEGYGIDAAALEQMGTELGQADGGTLGKVVGGALSAIGSAVSIGLSGTLALLSGFFIGAVLLFYTLADFPVIRRWITERAVAMNEAAGEDIVNDAVDALRGYFRGTTITSLVVALVVGAAMLLLKIPLVVAVTLVTFITGYIPFFGAIVASAFALLIALGSQGIGAAVALGVAIVLAQNLVQTVVNARVMGDSLDLHPLVVLVVTILGSIFGGLLGAALAAPLTALGVRAAHRLAAARTSADRVVTEP